METLKSSEDIEYYFTTDEPKNDEDYNPIALISNGVNKGEKIFILKDLKENDKNLTRGGMEVLTTFLERFYPKLAKVRFYNLIDLIVGKPLEKEDLVAVKIYNEFMKYKQEKPAIYFEHSTLEVIPDLKKREVIYISARSGSGKSTWIGGYVKLWRRMNKKSPIWLISTKPLSEEPAYQGLSLNQLDISVPNLKKIVGVEDKPMKKSKSMYDFSTGDLESEADPEMQKKPNMSHIDLTLQETNVAYRNFIDEDTGASMVIMDDFDGLSKIQTDLLYNILKSIAELGRAKNIYLIVCRHSLADAYKTKCIINEATKFVIFPNGLSKDGISYFVNSKLNISRDAFLDIMKLKGQHIWASISTCSPQHYITPHSVIMI